MYAPITRTYNTYPSYVPLRVTYYTTTLFPTRNYFTYTIYFVAFAGIRHPRYTFRFPACSPFFLFAARFLPPGVVKSQRTPAPASPVAPCLMLASALVKPAGWFLRPPSGATYLPFFPTRPPPPIAPIATTSRIAPRLPTRPGLPTRATTSEQK